MITTLSTDSKKHIVNILTTQKLNKWGNNYNLNVLHPNYFMYRHMFMKSYLPLLGESISDMQLVYMETDWENLLLRVEEQKDSSYTQQRTKTAIIKHKKVATLGKHSKSSFQIRTLVRRSPYEINKYYAFTNMRLLYSSRNYMYRLLKTSLPRFTNLRYTQNELKRARRVKVRSLMQFTTTLPTTTKSSFASDLMFTIRPRILITTFDSTLFTPGGTTRKFVAPKSSKYKPSRRLTNRRWMRKSLRLPSFWTNKIQTNNCLYTTKFSSPRRILKNYRSKKILNLHTLKTPIIKDSRYTPKAYKHSYSPSSFLVRVPTNLTRNRLNHTNIKSTVKLKIKTSRLSTFILRNVGVFILSKISWQYRFPTKLKSQLKKKLFSFIYSGQAKRSILNKRKKQVLTRLLSKSTQLITSLDKFSYRLFHQIFKTTQSNKSWKWLKTSEMSGLNSTSLSYSANLPHIQYDLPFQIKGESVEDLFIHQDVRIPRVRFKPGYQRIWRQVRDALKIALNVKFQYQKQLTKYLVKFYHLSNQYLLSYSESTLDKIILYSHLLPDMSTIQLFQKEGFIYLNGVTTLSTSNIIIKNDIIQLVVSVWYYMFNKWLTNWTQLRIKKFKRLVYRKNKPLQYKIMKNKKQISYYTPHWITQTRYDNTDIKPYVEVDFFTLSSVVLTETYTQHYHKPDDLPDLRNSTYLLYNWKYIT